MFETHLKTFSEFENCRDLYSLYLAKYISLLPAMTVSFEIDCKWSWKKMRGLIKCDSYPPLRPNPKVYNYFEVEVCPSYIFFSDSMINTRTTGTLGKNWFNLLVAVHHQGEPRRMKRQHLKEKKNQWLLTSVQAHVQLHFFCNLGMMLSRGGWALLHQWEINKMPHREKHWTIWQRQFFNWYFLFVIHLVFAYHHRRICNSFWFTPRSKEAL